MQSRLLHTSRVLAMASSKPAISVQIWSDIACPWCYVGKKRLDQAMEGLRDRAEFRPEWHAYLLDPNFGPQGVLHDEYYQQKFGARGPALKQHIKEAGAPDGATFKGWKWRGNTMAGHRLIALARQHGKDHEASELLFQKAYEEGANLSEAAPVVEVGQVLGLPGVEGYVADAEAGREEVESDDAFAKYTLQVSGVPFFLIGLESSDKRYSFSGAQPVANFKEIFERVLHEAEGAGQGQEGPAGAAGGQQQ